MLKDEGVVLLTELKGRIDTLLEDVMQIGDVILKAEKDGTLDMNREDLAYVAGHVSTVGSAIVRLRDVTEAMITDRSGQYESIFKGFKLD